MKITDIKLHWIEIPRSDSARMGWGINHYRQPYHDEPYEELVPTLQPGYCRSMIYEVHTDAGIIGYGEREEPFDIIDMAQLRATLVGMDPFDVEEIAGGRVKYAFVNHPKDIPAIEMACWDIIGKAAGQPLYKLMGGRVRDRVAIARFLGIRPIDQTVADAVAAIEMGIKTIKLKAGRNHVHDLDTLREVRDAVGEGIEIRVDPNGAWPVPTAISMINAMERHRPQYIEQPIPREDHDGFRRVKERTRVPICICEGLSTGHGSRGGLEALMDLIKLDAIDVVSTDPWRTGGVLGVKKLCAICEAAGIPVVFHWSRTGITQAAYLHLAVSNRPMLWAQDIIPVNIPTGPVDDVIAEPLLAVDGWMNAPERPGLGVEIDPVKLVRYAIKSM